jgi:hypothetical protein
MPGRQVCSSRVQNGTVGGEGVGRERGRVTGARVSEMENGSVVSV